MSSLKEIWDRATRFVGHEIKWLNMSICPRQESFTIVRDNDHPSYHFTPRGVPSEDWQKLLRDKIGGEVQHPYDISKAHSVYTAAYYDLVDGEGLCPRQAMKKMASDDFHVLAIEPEGALRIDDVLYPDRAGSAPRVY